MESSPVKRGADPNGDANAIKKSKKASKEGKSKDGKKDKAPNPEVELQQSLLRSDKALSDRFIQAFQEKPESISGKQFATQFWAARANLLRAHAVEREQKKANYNVLSAVKPQVVEGSMRVTITPEQIEDVFRQHPVLRKAYDETIPNKFKTNMDFWSAFFMSRLFKSLKGERINDADPTDPVLDKYLASEQEAERGQQVAESHIPHFIDLEGNEQNHSQRKGNQPDLMMRPNASDKVPILRVLNSMSEKIMAHVTPADGDPHKPIGMDEETYNELVLRDLQAESGSDRVVLNIKKYQQLGSAERESRSENSRSQKLDPHKVLASIKNDLQKAGKGSEASYGLDLSGMTGLNDDSDPRSHRNDDDDSNAPRARDPTEVHSATKDVQRLIRQQKERLSQDPDGLVLPQSIMQDLILTHHTSNEFLRFFWRLVNNPQAPATLEAELPPLLATLDKSLTRIAAIGIVAEDERKSRLSELKKQVAEARRLGQRKNLSEKDAGPGKSEVQWLMEPIVRAIGLAKDTFENGMTMKGAEVS